ncbi:hypothetical protein BDV18DRAFT_146632 [Aspergillus unguis]
MPGVPTGRGCDACRKQKKKCIFDEANPVCSRCARLGLECIGRGTQRYIFKAEYAPKSKSRSNTKSKSSSPASQHNGSVKEESRAASASTSSSNSTKATPNHSDLDFSALTKTPSSRLITLTQSFTATMGPGVDLRYNLAWAYGGFIRMIPQRLGVNEALDASVDALVASHLAIACGNGISVDALSKNSRALRTLRKCLDNPVEATTSETLCAIVLLLIVQSMHDPSQHKRSGHAEGAAAILQARKRIKPRDDFDALLLLSLRGLVLFEGIFNPDIHLSSEEWKDLVESDLDTATFQEGKMLYCLSRVPTILGRARSLNQDIGSEDRANDEETEAQLKSIQLELQGLYTTTRSICDEFRVRLSELEAPGALYAAAAVAPLKLQPVMLHAHYQRMYAYVMIINLYLNYILVAMYSRVGISPGETDTHIKTESESEPDISTKPEMDSMIQLRLDAIYDAHEMLKIAENAIMYRPLGAVHVPWGLLAARMTVGLGPHAGYQPDELDLTLLEALERSYWDYQSDFNGTEQDMTELEGPFSRLRPFDVTV